MNNRIKTFIALTAILIFSICPFGNFLWAQSEKQNLTHTILLKDSLFWIAYNKCDVNSMQQFFTDDLEFYHDKGGLTLGLENLIAGIRKNLCGNENFRLRREAVDGTVKVFPLQNADTIYGAVISGEHVFYVLETGKAERLDGLAKFTDLWILKQDGWKMSRILSYDHGPAPYKNPRKPIKLTAAILNQFVGQYTGPQAGLCKVQMENDVLHLLIGDNKYVLYPETNTRFFVTDRDLIFEFAENKDAKISKLIVRENGKIVEEAVRN